MMENYVPRQHGCCAGYSGYEPKLAGITWAPIIMDWQCGAGTCVPCSDPLGTQHAPEYETATSGEAGVDGKGARETSMWGRACAVIDLVTWGNDVSKSKKENATSGEGGGAHP